MNAHTIVEPRAADELCRLAESAYRIRRYALRMGEVQGQGYIGQALGIADVFAVAYRHALNLHPDDPEWEGRDRFLLSHGHYAIAHYAALIEAGVIPQDELDTYGSDDSRLPMSGMASYTPGMEISGGSLGQGLAIGVGMALGLRQKKNPAWVYVSMSDGELDEGATWEAAMSAHQHRLAHLIALVDINNQQADGRSHDILSFEPLADKWNAFGWFVQRVDGNDIAAVLEAFDSARAHDGDAPRVILFDTLIGKGVDFLERRERNHFIKVEPPEWRQAIDVLDATQRDGAGK
ncbi:transketolase [Paralcaligenes sp. KSB-10]|uniref:transketolase n=1 Tax=Paralcaligenes sp. KSB-10 TaxID=2901142 RepID=UPI001E5CD4A0|nr:transketolase [Paralcaligenes sp. KSB-10]UHL62462.1 transketolase [Paralcaligenes sp. KSB-10]